jgi:hypothetical protein
MQENTRDAVGYVMIGLGFLGLLAMTSVLGFQCQRQRTDVVKACLAAGKPPLECDLLLWTRQ